MGALSGALIHSSGASEKMLEEAKELGRQIGKSEGLLEGNQAGREFGRIETVRSLMKDPVLLEDTVLSQLDESVKQRLMQNMKPSWTENLLSMFGARKK